MRGSERTGRGTGWDNGAMKASFGDDVDFHCGVSTRVVDLTSVDLCDGHFAGK